MSLDLYLTRDACPHCGRGDAGWSCNITHNLNKMADEAGIYGVLWLPEENGITTAAQLIEPLRKAIAEMKADPERFKAHNAKNGWGLYENFVPRLEELLVECERTPSAAVRANR